MATTAHAYTELPEGWERVAADGPGPFVTSEVLRAPDGSLVRWRSRLHRKRVTGLRRGVWWRPDRVSWWMGLLFAIGSACFALAAIVSQWASAPRPAIGVTYFVGSIFFTVAAYLQFNETVNVDHGPVPGAASLRWRPASWEPRRIDWLASAIQLAGTLFFNVSTFAGMKHGFDARQSNLRVWTPDVFGSICFLVSSELAYAEVCHRWVCLRARSLSWRIVTLNLVGSIAFGVSAVTSLIEPSTQEPVSAAIANAGTAVGALCFLAGAIMLAPEADTDREPERAPADFIPTG
jgi:predicted membrane protein